MSDLRVAGLTWRNLKWSYSPQDAHMNKTAPALEAGQ